MRPLLTAAMALAMLGTALTGFAQAQRSQEFKDKYKLKEAVVLSRHNIRSPLSDSKSTVGRMTPHQWNKWTAGKSELTLRGGVLETQMGQYFRKWAADAGLFEENHVPTTDEVIIVGNSMQRTSATARYFATGFMPVGDLVVLHRYSPSKMDPLFNPVLTKVSPEFRQKALAQIDSMAGPGGLRGLNERLAPDYQFLFDVIDYKNSPVAKENGEEAKGLTNYDTEMVIEDFQEPHFKPGSALPGMNLASDALVLQYYETPDSVKAAFGKKLTRKDWARISHIKDSYQDALFTSPMVAVNVARPLVQFMYDELRSPDRKFALLVGHDSNLGAVTTALGVEEYEAPQAIEKHTPIGSKLVVEKFIGPDGQEYADVNLVYQSIDQLRNMELLDLDNPPVVLPLSLKGLQKNADGLYKMEDVLARFDNTLRAYDQLP